MWENDLALYSAVYFCLMTFLFGNETRQVTFSLPKHAMPILYAAHRVKPQRQPTLNCHQDITTFLAQCKRSTETLKCRQVLWSIAAETVTKWISKQQRCTSSLRNWRLNVPTNILSREQDIACNNTVIMCQAVVVEEEVAEERENVWHLHADTSML